MYSTNIQLTARVQFTGSKPAERFRVIEYFVALKKITTSCSVAEPAVTNQVQLKFQPGLNSTKEFFKIIKFKKVKFEEKRAVVSGGMREL